MRRYDLTEAKRVRESGGVQWHHYRCPCCSGRGTPDPSFHLGIGIRGQDILVKCLRCGAGRKEMGEITLLVRGERIASTRSGVWKGAEVPETPEAQERAPEAFRKGRLPGTWVGGISRSTVFAQKMEERALELWPGLTWEDLVAGGLRVSDPYMACFYLPYWTPEGWGYVERGEGTKLQRGPTGPGFLRELDLERSRHWVVVEGVADAYAVPAGWEPLILLGTGNSVGERVKGDFHLLMDGDEPGRLAGLRQRARLYKDGYRVTLTDLPWGEDPASLGKEKIEEWLRA